MVIARTKKDLEMAKSNRDDKIIVEGTLARRLTILNNVRKSAGFFLMISSLLVLPLIRLFTKSTSTYSGPAPGFRYPLSSGGLPNLPETASILVVLALGVFILWIPWSKYEFMLLNDKPVKVILMRK